MPNLQVITSAEFKELANEELSGGQYFCLYLDFKSVRSFTELDGKSDRTSPVGWVELAKPNNIRIFT